MSRDVATAGAFRPNLFAFAKGDVQVSFEFFPPKTEKMQETLWETVTKLAPMKPRFVSVTYGAGGTTRERTHDTVIRIQQEAKLPVAAHLTCVGSPKAEVDEIAARYWEEGVRHIVALRGDPPEGEARYRPHRQGYRNAADLVAGLKRIADFEISVAAYPERHVDSADWDAELDNLKAKVDAGATRAITQYFFDPALFLRLRDRVAAAGIDIPLVPGVMPVTNFHGIVNFSKKCGATVPGWLAALFEGLDDHPATRQMVAAAVSAELCRRLYDDGVTEFHFYTLNRAALTYAICHTLGLRPTETKR